MEDCLLLVYFVYTKCNICRKQPTSVPGHDDHDDDEGFLDFLLSDRTQSQALSYQRLQHLALLSLPLARKCPTSLPPPPAAAAAAAVTPWSFALITTRTIIIATINITDGLGQQQRRS